MPELPEVQTIVDDLNKKIIGRRITGVWFDWPKMISIIFADRRGKLCGTTQNIEKFKNIFEKELKGLKITKIRRRGKNILLYFNKNKRSTRGTSIEKILLIHQKLTGHLLIGKWKIEKISGFKFQVSSLIKGPLEESVNNYIHLIFYLDNGWQLGLSDLRKFAKVLFGPKEEIEKMPDLVKIGPEPLNKNFTLDKFKEVIRFKSGKIKQVLMDQKAIAGIGNIYSDEILWQAKVYPFKPANQLRVDELKSLYLAMRQILEKAVKLRGTSISDYRDITGELGAYTEVRLVYQREGEPCKRCQAEIQRIKIGGRSAHFCPKCQK